MNRVIYYLVYALISLSCTNMLYSQEKKLKDYSNDEFKHLIETNGKELVQTHGEEILELLQWRIPTKSMEDQSVGLKRRTRKNDLPMYRVLKEGGSDTINLLNRTKYFKYPRRLSELEILAFLLFEINGQKNALLLCDGKVTTQKGYEKENWAKISEFLRKPDLSEGFFYTEKIANNDLQSKVNSIIAEQNTELEIKKLINSIDDAKIDEFLQYHFKFRKILRALESYKSEKNTWPNSLYLLVISNHLLLEDISFIDSEGFVATPHIAGKLEQNDAQQKFFTSRFLKAIKNS